MAVEQFPYLNRSPTLGHIGLMPYMPLTLKSDQGSVTVEGLLDTGAALNVLPWDLGLQLGFVWQQQTIALPLTGNLASNPARAVLVEVTVGRLPSVPLGFAWTKAKDVPVLLGQSNFFLEFDVCFFRSRCIFEVQPRQP